MLSFKIIGAAGSYARGHEAGRHSRNALHGARDFCIGAACQQHGDVRREIQLRHRSGVPNRCGFQLSVYIDHAAVYRGFSSLICPIPRLAENIYRRDIYETDYCDCQQ